VYFVRIWVFNQTAYRDKESCPVSLLRFRAPLQQLLKVLHAALAVREVRLWTLCVCPAATMTPTMIAVTMTRLSSDEGQHAAGKWPTTMQRVTADDITITAGLL
jgi:hypothetical protein